MSGLVLDPIVRWGLFSAGLLLPIALAVVTRLALSPAVSAAEEVEWVEALISCDSTLLDATCPQGLVCVADVCRDLDLEPRCPAGEPCPSSLCEAGAEVHGGRCIRPEDVDLAPATCRRDRHWEKTIRELQRRCAGLRKEPQAPLTACDATLWEDVNRSDESFESGILELPGTFSVHFPEGEPKRPSWPPSAIREYYRERLGEQRATLERAKVIFVIGRASMRSGTSEYNQEVASRRADLVRDLLRELLGPEARIIRWSLASQLSLPPSEFQRPGHAPPIAWDAETTGSLARRLDPRVERGELSVDAWTDLSDTLNRVVLVVPIDCDGTEFFPLPSFRGRER